MRCRWASGVAVALTWVIRNKKGEAAGGHGASDVASSEHNHAGSSLSLGKSDAERSVAIACVPGRGDLVLG